MKRTRCLATLALLLFTHAAWARPNVVEAHPVLAEGLRQSLNMRLNLKEDLHARFNVVLRVDPAFTPRDEARLERGGVTLERVDGRIARVGPYLGASLDVVALRKLLANPLVKRVFAAPRNTPPAASGNPFSKTWGWTGVEPVWPRQLAADVRTQGQGVVLCDLDSAMEVFHPLLFRPDGGLYAWLDLNGNGHLDPGVDAVDLDGNGVASPEERLRATGGQVTDATGTVVASAPFHPARHFLFADTNDTGAREYGPAAGFTESTPAYGEPLFVADDVNNNGVVDVGEKLIRLKTSKIKGVYRPSTGQSYERGTNLIDVPITTDSSHGSAVAGILVGGVHGTTWVQGVAPQADLLGVVQDAAMGEFTQDSAQYQANRVASLAWAQNRGTRIFVHEYGQANAEFADGSGDWEHVIDQLEVQGAIQATAAHNFAGNNGRVRLQLAPGQAVDIPLDMLDYAAYGYSSVTLRGTLRWLGGANDVAVTLKTLSNALMDAGATTQQGRDVTFGTRTVSPRGTAMVDFAYAHLDTTLAAYENVPVGAYNVHVVNNSAVARDVFAYFTDDTAYAFFVDAHGPHDDTSSMAHPSTADSAVVVAAFRVNTLDHGEAEGDLAYYSGRGPRIDGARTIAVTAPADQYSASPVAGQYQVFDGTSGALPQVAGALALLLQKEPGLTPAQAKARLASGSRADVSTGTVPNHQWGAGRLDVQMLLYGQHFAANLAPNLVVSAPSSVDIHTSATLDASASTDDHDALSGLILRWDVDYDGTWDSTGPSATVPVDTVGARWVLVEAEDTGGFVSRRLLSIVGVTPGSTSSSSSTVASSGNSSGASASAGASSSGLNPSSSTSAPDSSLATSASSGGVASSAATSAPAPSSGTTASSTMASSSSLPAPSSAAVSSGSSLAAAASSTGANDQSPPDDNGSSKGCGNCAQGDSAGLLGLLAVLGMLRRRRPR